MSKGIKITAELAEKLTPPKTAGGKAKRLRAAVLMRLAECLEKQRSYQLATKKYTQANSKMKALKCLLKSGDTKKIIYYATHAKKKEIYVTAANFLRNLEWQNNPELTKQIIKFYKKAATYDKLGNFYDACAQFEIDECVVVVVAAISPCLHARSILPLHFVRILITIWLAPPNIFETRVLRSRTTTARPALPTPAPPSYRFTVSATTRRRCKRCRTHRSSSIGTPPRTARRRTMRWSRWAT